MSEERIKLTEKELLYAATARCKCGAGLAYPLDHKLAMAVRAWVCSAVLKGDVEDTATQRTPPMFGMPQAPSNHDAFDFAFWKIREETSVNNRGAHTTRPPGTIARTVGKAKCPKCNTEWRSEPYNAAATQRHWDSGPCPNCGNDNYCGNNRPYVGEERIDARFPDVVLDADGATP